MRKRRGLLLAIVLLAAVSPATAAEGPSPAQRKASALMREGNKLLEQGDYVGALELFKDAYAQFPSPKITLNIGTTLKQLGRFAEAAIAYERYLADPGRDPKREAEVRELLLALDQRIGRLRFEGVEAETRVLVDGNEVSPANTLRLDPGRHTVVAEMPSRTTQAQTVELTAGQELAVVIELVPLDPPKEAAPPPTMVTKEAPPPTPVAVPEPGIDSARGRIGLLARVDVDPISGGAGVAGCVSYAPTTFLELFGGGLFGRTLGAYVGAQLSLLEGPIQPLLTAGVPIYFHEGARPGVHAAAGVAWAPAPTFSAHVLVGIEQFLRTPVGYRSTLFVPSAGVQVRL